MLIDLTNMKTTTFLLACLSGLGVFTISEGRWNISTEHYVGLHIIYLYLPQTALKCYKGTTVADVNALTESTCDSGVTVCKRCK